MGNKKFCPANCIHLSPTESAQIDSATELSTHMCVKYNQPVFHAGFEPELVRLVSCAKDSKKEFAE